MSKNKKNRKNTPRRVEPSAPSNITQYLDRMASDSDKVAKMLMEAPVSLTGSAEPKLFRIITEIRVKLSEAKDIWK